MWDPVRGTGEGLYDFGCVPRYRKLYFETYVNDDPIRAAVLSSSPGEVISHTSIMPRGDFMNTRFYQEYIEPQGWQENVFVTLARSPTQVAALVIARGKQDGWADEGVYRRLRLILPHLVNAALIASAVRLRTGQIMALADILDAISAGVFLIDAENRIVHANASGHALLANGILSGVVTANQMLQQMGISQTPRSALTGAHRKGTPFAGRSIALPINSADGERYVAHCLKLDSEPHREAAETYGGSPRCSCKRQILMTPRSARPLPSITN
jgi:hypothetical protein